LISEIIMPDLGATGGDVTLVRWLVAPSDQVRAGQPLFLVETDKATVEVEAYRDGLVRELLVEEGASVPLGSPVAIIADSMEESLVKAEAKPGSQADAQPAAKPLEAPAQQEARILASPLARRMAQREGLNLEAVRGTGRQGQILKRDVERSLTSAQAKPGVVDSARREPVTAMRRAIARRTQLSKAEAPHFYADITVDMAEALALRQAAVEWADEKGWAPPSLTDLCLRATALTLLDFPTLNASYQGEEVLYYQAINIGLVVGLADGGMLVPVVREANRANLYTLAAITRRLKQQAEKGVLKETEMSGGTFTLSNLGMYGLDSFTAVINPPQAGILALGAVQERPAVLGGAVVPRPLMQATLSVDHRLVDGIVAARFLAAWKEMLENPTRLTLEPPEEIA
jgi:pyruvate dehydrogenase E2 component (dihydrolipoamide acetyltransferase)